MSETQIRDQTHIRDFVLQVKNIARSNGILLRPFGHRHLTQLGNCLTEPNEAADAV
ncbi:hypothetical protein HG15A2_48180 [Adhaeretor mobilis]|uniref:Uncharacterized protein n=1 Tax=Adhaeretor mobilis TaxID=1930276 RepID=A0A517N2W6_9BACT|nr:hypothetical protein HG15A2_48180 [Adhaeretor mobilis]